jgi:uncharacterized protein
MSFLHGVEVVELDDGTRAVRTASASVIGLVGTAPEADAEVFPLNEPVLVLGSRQKLAALGKGGTLPDALGDILEIVGAAVVVIRVEEGEDQAGTISNVIGGVDAETGKYQGVQALMAAGSTVGARPRILIATGFTHQVFEDSENAGEYLLNPVVASLTSVADKLRAVVVVDGPNTTDAEVVKIRDLMGSKRVFFHDPWYRYWDTEINDVVTRPASATLAGLIAWNDNQRGWHTSPSNQLVPGIMGLGREIDFVQGEKNCRANFLNSHDIAVTIQESGMRLWGNRTTSSDPKWAFLAHVRIADIINDSLQAAHLWAVDRNMNTNYYEDVRDSVQLFINRLVAERRIAGGTCWIEPELNTPQDMMDGRSVFDFDFSPFGIAERITFRSRMVNNYLEEIF